MNFNKILVVDDDSVIRHLIVTFLQLHGFAIKTAANGEEAILALQNETFDVIVTDLIMGKVNGQEVLRYAKNKEPGTLLIMITGNCREESKTQAFENGADAFLCKPFPLEQLLDYLPTPALNL